MLLQQNYRVQPNSIIYTHSRFPTTYQRSEKQGPRLYIITVQYKGSQRSVK